MKKKPQKGNPHGLTVKQHCFPRRSIERFVNDEGVVSVRLIEQGKSILLRPDDQLFCAGWIWDQQAEEGFMREVEDTFQHVTSDIVEGGVARRLRAIENRAITDMYALWWVRSMWRDAPVPDQRIENAMGVSHELLRGEREELEKAWVASIRPDLTIDGRHIASGLIRLNFLEVKSGLENLKWAIFASREVEFLVPDQPVAWSLPVTPRLCLAPGWGYRIASRTDVERWNTAAVHGSRRYFFAKSPVGANGFVDTDVGESALIDRGGDR